MGTRARHDVFARGGGETGALLRSLDWSATSLGPVTHWPRALRSAVSTMLLSKAQIALCWGDELTFLYNDAYSAILDDKHPRAFALPIREAWAELWDAGLSDLLLAVYETGDALRATDRPFFMQRSGYLEETYFDISYDPLVDDDGMVRGVFAIVNETTRRVLGERRLRTLSELGRITKPGDRPETVHAGFERVLRDCVMDLPFALVYVRDETDDQLQLRARSGLAAGHAAAPETLSGTAGEAWPTVDVVTELTGRDLAALGPLATRPWPEPVTEVLIAPLADRGQAADGLLVAGLSPRLRLDDEYRDFVSLVAGGIGRAFASAELAAEERRRAKLLSDLFAQTPVPTAVLKGRELVFDLVNPAFESVLPGRRLHGERFDVAVPELGAQGHTDRLREVLASGEPHVAQEDRVDLVSDGILEARYFTYIFAPLRDVTQRVEGVIIIGVEVTEQVLARQRVEALAAELTEELEERKRAQAALVRSEERLSRVLDAADLGVWELDMRTDAYWRSLQHDRIFGYERLQPRWNIELGLAHVLPEDREAMASGIDHAREAGGEWEAEFRIRRTDGEVRWVWMQAATTTDAAGKVTHMKGVLRDVTARKAIEQAQHEEAQRKDEFLATLSHELRNPLAPLRNALHLLGDGRLDDDKRARARGIMERQVEHLVRLVDDLLDLSRITRGTIELRRERVALAEVVRNAVDTVEPLIDESGHALAVDVPDESLDVHGDPVRLAQILSNLLNNAAKYTDRGGHLFVSAKRERESVEVTVSDDGRGLEPAQIPRMFEMFTRGTGSDERAQGGLGIGLALARRLAEMHGGTLSAESGGRGHGSAFVLRLPLADAASRSPARRTATGDPFSARRFLVVDDNPDAGESLGLVLEGLNAEVRIVLSGPAALEAIEVFAPDVVLLDIGMPEMDGYEVARRLRAGNPDSPMLIVALTGWGQSTDRRRAAEAGFDHHLTKPLELEALRRLLDAHKAGWPPPGRKAGGAQT